MEFNDFDWEIEKVAKVIEESDKDKVLIMLPEGLKVFAIELVRRIKEMLTKKVEIFIWINSNYGPCDILEVKQLEDFLIINFGHIAWKT